VQSPPVHHEHAALPCLPGSEQEALQRSLRLLPGEAVQIHVALNGNLSCPQLPDEVRVEGRQVPLDELVGVREVERCVSSHKLGEPDQHLGILVHPGRKLGPLLRLNAVSTRRERLHLSDRGEELGGLVVLARRRGPWPWRSGR